MLFAFSPVTLGASRTEESASISNTTDVKLNLRLRSLCCVCYTFRALSLKPYCSSRVNAGFHYSNSVTLFRRGARCARRTSLTSTDCKDIWSRMMNLLSYDDSNVPTVERLSNSNITSRYVNTFRHLLYNHVVETLSCFNFFVATFFGWSVFHNQ